MCRHGYSEEYEQPGYGMYRGRVASAIRGKRGQRLLRELLAALDAMPYKRLIKDAFVLNGYACALGVVALSRGIPDPEKIDSEDHDYLAKLFDIAPCLVREIQYENDEPVWSSDPIDALVERWEVMREWVSENIRA